MDVENVKISVSLSAAWHRCLDFFQSMYKCRHTVQSNTKDQVKHLIDGSTTYLEQYVASNASFPPEHKCLIFENLHVHTLLTQADSRVQDPEIVLALHRKAACNTSFETQNFPRLLTNMGPRL